MLGVVVIGPVARQELDLLSDLDLVVLVHNTAFERFFPTRAWFGSLGALLGYEGHAGQGIGTHRLLLTDGRRIDLIVMSEAALEREGFQAFWRPALPLFSRSALLEQRLQESVTAPAFAPLSDRDFQSLVEAFWYRASVASLKVAQRSLDRFSPLLFPATRSSCASDAYARPR